MHKMTTVVLAALLCVSVAQAQDKKSGEKAAASPKISKALIKKITDCQKEAKTKKLKGDPRKLFVSRCIDGKDAAPRLAAAKAAEEKREKKRSCINKVKLRVPKGEEREKALKACLKD